MTLPPGMAINNGTHQAGGELSREGQMLAKSLIRSLRRVANDLTEGGSSDSQAAWFYKDESGQTQGPFPGSQIHEWHSQGYLPDSLLVRKGENCQFYHIHDLFDVERDVHIFLDEDTRGPVQSAIQDLGNLEASLKTHDPVDSSQSTQKSITSHTPSGAPISEKKELVLGKPRAGSDWIPYMDDATGTVYFYNSVSFLRVCG